MANVIIEGTGSWVGLGRGQRRTVPLTPRYRKLAARGFVTFVTDPTPTGQEGTTAADPLPTSDLPAAEGEVEYVDDTVEDTSDVPHGPPSKNASRKEWAAWFEAEAIGYPDNATRDLLVAAWEQVEQQRAQEQQ